MRQRILGLDLMLLLYQWVLFVVGPVYLAVRFLRGKRLGGLRERLGCHPSRLKRSLRGLRQPIWIHLVSVGEVLAASSLIREIRSKAPQLSWVITTTTLTGQELAKRLVRPGQDELLYLPWDFSFAVSRAVGRIRPRLFISFETELWPVLFHHLGRKGVPILVVNGRISPAAYKRYLVGRFFMERVLRPVQFFLAQSPQDARRFAAIGASKDRILVTGNLKWDLPPLSENDGSSRRELLQLADKDLLWTAGSTHPGEEKLILEVYSRLKERHSSLRLLIAPRHPERASEVEQEVARIGLSSIRRSQLGEGSPGKSESSDSVLVLDTVGELNSFYQASDLVFVGGSLVAHGGHNMIEPAAFRKPIVTGPHLDNFQSVAESLFSAGGVDVVQSGEELEKSVGRLLEDPRARSQMGERAYQAIGEHRGATARTVNLIFLRWGATLLHP